MRTKLIIISIVIQLSMMSCNNQKNISNCRVYETSLKDEYNSYKYMFFSEEKLYLLGSYQENSKSTSAESSFVKEIRIDIDGNRIDNVAKIRGEIEVATQSRNYFYIVSLEYLSENYNYEISKHKLYRISPPPLAPASCWCRDKKVKPCKLRGFFVFKS